MHLPYNWRMETVICTADPMPRKFFQQHLPSHETVRNNKHAVRFDGLLQHHKLWHLNRHSVAGDALGLTALGYTCVQLGWRFYVIRAWRNRRHTRSKHGR